MHHCGGCRAGFTTKQLYKKHLWLRQFFSCHVCELRCETHNRRQIHLETHYTDSFTQTGVVGAVKFSRAATDLDSGLPSLNRSFVVGDL